MPQVARRVQDSTRSMAGCTALQGLAGRVGACAPPVVEAIRGCIKVTSSACKGLGLRAEAG